VVLNFEPFHHRTAEPESNPVLTSDERRLLERLDDGLTLGQAAADSSSHAAALTAASPPPARSSAYPPQPKRSSSTPARDDAETVQRC